MTTRRIGYLVLAVLLFHFATPAYAWWDSGHMVVAYIAYQKLKPETRQRVAELLKRNPQYGRWTAGVPEDRQSLIAFLNGATWPDCIKSQQSCPGYVSDGPDGGNTPPPTPQASQNVGYSDTAQHKYWHFVDEPFSSDGTPVDGPKYPSAESEIVLLAKAISTDEADDLKSYDLVWLEHLVGDIHQPLHATSRFSHNHPNGDAGGNLISLCAQPCHNNLHAYWDGLFGDKISTAQVERIGRRLLEMPLPPGYDRHDVHTWVEESFELAKADVYVAPIGADSEASETPKAPDDTYHSEAATVANQQVLLAGVRLAGMLNSNLK